MSADHKTKSRAKTRRTRPDPAKAAAPARKRGKADRLTTDYPEKRKEVRFPIATSAIVKAARNGQPIRTTTVDMSGCGVLLHFEKNPPLTVGDEVSCEYRIPSESPESLPSWIVGRVVRVADNVAAIEFEAGVFPPKPLRR